MDWKTDKATEKIFLPSDTPKTYIGRFAPTPSGFLHLGNLFCSLLAWLFAKKNSGKIILRIEDLDTSRCTRERADTLARDLEWLGLIWDEGAYASENSESYFQSKRSAIYEQFFQKLQKQQLVYPCFCSRADLHAANAPHASDGHAIYAGTCRDLTRAQQEERQNSLNHAPAYRVRVDNSIIEFNDAHYGTQCYNLAQESGDFIIRRSDGLYAYQLAVTVDDALMGITQVVRGNDLLSSTPIQLYLYEKLGLTPPDFLHIPLLVAPDGRRLAKRDGDLELAALRNRFKSAEPIIGWLAYLAGQLKKPEALTVQDLLHIFNPDKLPQKNIIVPNELLSR